MRIVRSALLYELNATFNVMACENAMYSLMQCTDIFLIRQVAIHYARNSLHICIGASTEQHQHNNTTCTRKSIEWTIT